MKGKGGKRASRFSSAVCGRAPPERPKERQQEESRGQNDREKGEGEENERKKEMWSANRTAKSRHAQTQKEIADPKQEQSVTRKKIEVRTKHAREFLRVSVSSVVLWRVLNDGLPFILFGVVLFQLVVLVKIARYSKPPRFSNLHSQVFRLDIFASSVVVKLDLVICVGLDVVSSCANRAVNLLFF